MDFWSNGDPPRHYQIIDSLTDERHKTGLWGAIRMSSLDSDIANAAKAAGGDAVIVLGEQDQVTGVVGSTFGDASGTYGSGNFNANAFSVGSARAVKEHNSRYWVIKYLQDVVPTVGTSTPAASP